jgi:hypothetical protein
VNPFSDQGGAFEISATASNGGIDLDFPNSPHTSFLKVTGHTSNARQYIHLNQAYEGTWDVTTTDGAGSPDIFPDPSPNHLKDPSGMGRRPTALLGGRKSWGPWDDSAKHYGSVTLRSSNAKPTLIY